jgi:hypothetical protein
LYGVPGATAFEEQEKAIPPKQTDFQHQSEGIPFPDTGKAPDQYQDIDGLHGEGGCIRVLPI